MLNSSKKNSREVRWLCVFDIFNDQNSYARILQTIQWLESINEYGEEPSTSKDLLCPFKITYAPDSGILDVEWLNHIETMLANATNNHIRTINDKERLLLGLQKRHFIHGFSYYFRIHMSDEKDIVNLQYLILLLQSESQIEKRVAVRLMEVVGDTWGAENYFKVTHYLQFVLKRYPFFYACETSTISSLRKLGTKKNGVQKSFVPLMIIDENLQNEFHIHRQLSRFDLSKSFIKLKKNLSFATEGLSDRAESLYQIGLKMFFDNLDGRNFLTKEKCQALFEALRSSIEQLGGLTPLEMLLFGALSKNPILEDNHRKFIYCLTEIKKFSNSVLQILENVLYHSELKTGVFGFRIHKRESYIVNNYPGIGIEKGSSFVELFVSDKNEKDNIVRNFLDGNKAGEELRQFSFGIKLPNFFGWPADSSEAVWMAWQHFRKENKSLCHGLPTFASIGYKLGSAIRVRSSTNFTVATGSEQLYFVSDHLSSAYNNANNYWIPGTQYSFLTQSCGFWRTNETRRNSFQFPHLTYTTTYQELARCLCLENNYVLPSAKLEKQLLKANYLEEQGQSRKDYLTIIWKDWFNNCLQDVASLCSSSLVLEFDLTELLREDTPGYVNQIEPFCKGFLDSKFFHPDKPTKYILFSNASLYFGQVFCAALNAAKDSLVLDEICVYFYPNTSKEVPDTFAASLYEMIDESAINNIFPRIFPRDLIRRNGELNTVFEQEMLSQANCSITCSEMQGYKIENTHLRLGNKVHIDSFYEMALFFENHNYAYFTAFLFLKKLMREEYLKGKKILFYGYSSYSRGILWALTKVWKEFLLISNISSQEVAFSIYQNDLQIESGESGVQMYYSKHEWQNDPASIWNEDEVSLIQIVPISSSLTTFMKMQAKLNEETGRNFTPAVNLTAFWVRDDYECKWDESQKKENVFDRNAIYKNLNVDAQEGIFKNPTEEESSFWDEVSSETKQIKSKLLGDKTDTFYLVNVTSYWRSPLTCTKCFPADPIFEFPLVETDPTSTIPTQQFYLESNENASKHICVSSENDNRVARLKDLVLYGHISRSSNHYQYYVRTRRYFHQESEEIKNWLIALRQEQSEESINRIVNVLIYPKHASNVEFGQYVYEYYFGGEAENIVVNTEKEFRSNFKAEYNGLFHRLKDHIEHGYKIRFHYIDTAINSGSTFTRAATLVATYFNEAIGSTNEYLSHSHPFENVFLLVSRLSENSKFNYVQRPEKGFHAYVELHISSMRTFGDSCVPCKLQKEADKYYKNAATKAISAYWEVKSFNRIQQHFDSAKGEKIPEEGYLRMICSHRLRDHILVARGGDLKQYFQAVRNFYEELCRNLSGDEHAVIFQYMDDYNQTSWLSAALKIIVRPFFSFDYNIRRVSMDLLLLLSEYFLKYSCLRGDVERTRSFLQDLENRLTPHKEKSYLCSDNCAFLKWIYNFAKTIEAYFEGEPVRLLEFVRHNLLKGLADIKANYILRKDTLAAVFCCVANASKMQGDFNTDDFYMSYLRSILRVTHSSSDETRSVWLEYLLQNGVEYGESEETSARIETIIPTSTGTKQFFERFRELLLIENNRSLLQSMSEISKVLDQNKRLESKEATQCIAALLSKSHMRNVTQYLNAPKTNIINKPKEEFLYALWKLYSALNCDIISSKDSVGSSVEEKYGNLRALVHNIASVVHSGESEVLIFEKWDDQVDSSISSFPPYCMISPDNDSRNPFEAVEILNYLRQHEEQWGKDIKEYGYYLWHTITGNRYQILLALDNNFEEVQSNCRYKDIMPYRKQKISPIYIYIQGKNPFSHSEAIQIVRAVLMLRIKLVQWVERDFNNDMIERSLQYKNIARHLSESKVSDHQDEELILGQQILLTQGAKPDLGNYVLWEAKQKEEVIRSHTADRWYILCAYVNSIISRLYRTCVRSRGIDGSLNRRIGEYYASSKKKPWNLPAGNLSDIFFKNLTVDHSRDRYLEILLHLFSFTIQGSPDYSNDAGVEFSSLLEVREGIKHLDSLRLERLKELFKQYDFVSFEKNGEIYAYGAEYLVVALMDCCISALKAANLDKEWSQTDNMERVFCILNSLPPEKKCYIHIYREAFQNDCDYLVIENELSAFKAYTPKKEHGMSQTAIAWYIQEFWRFKMSEVSMEDTYRPVFSILKEPLRYATKLPILKPEKGER